MCKAWSLETLEVLSNSYSVFFLLSLFFVTIVLYNYYNAHHTLSVFRKNY